MSDEGFLESLDRRMENGFRDLNERTDKIRLHFDARLEVLQAHAVSTDHSTANIDDHLRNLNGQMAKTIARLAILEEERDLEKKKAEAMANYRAGLMAWRERWKYRLEEAWAAVTSSTGRTIILGLLVALGVGAWAERVMQWWPE